MSLENYKLKPKRKYGLMTNKNLSPFLRDYIIWFNVTSFIVPESVADVMWAWKQKYIERQLDKKVTLGSQSFWEVMLKGSLLATTEIFIFGRTYIMTEDESIRKHMREEFMNHRSKLPPLALVEFFNALDTEVEQRIIARQFDGDSV
jgi:hypothetical protein